MTCEPPPVAALPGLADGHDRTRLALLAAAIVVLWVATRPYAGIVHDSRLYTLLALRPDHPGLATDLFLQFGSQDRFTLFSPLYRPLIALLGVGQAAMTLTLVAQLLWLGAAYGLAKTVVRDTALALAAVAGAVALPSAYGSGGLFSYGEAFITPRLFAEAATMAALTCALRRRFGLATVAIVAGGVLHPVMVLPGAVVVILYGARRSRQVWLGAAGVAAVVIGLAASGVEPFGRLLVTFDPEWLAVARGRASETFILGWKWPDFLLLVGNLALASTAMMHAAPAARRLLGIVICVAVAGVALTFLGADILHNELLTSLQVWRATWLSGFIGNLFLIPAALNILRDKTSDYVLKAAVLGGTFFLFESSLLGIEYVPAVMLFSIAAVSGLNTTRSRPSRILSRITPHLVPVSIIFTAIAAIIADRTTTRLSEDGWATERQIAWYVSGLGLLLLGCARQRQWRWLPKAKWLALGMASALALVSVSWWDGRTSWTRLIESNAPAHTDLQAFAPASATIYWSGGLELLWLHLKQPSYFSCAQGAGVIFFRGTALAFAHRHESLRFEPPKSELCSSGLTKTAVLVSDDELRRACRREPALDYIILPDDLPGLWDRWWQPPVQNWQIALHDGRPAARIVARYYRYPCAALRKTMPDPARRSQLPGNNRLASP